VTLDTTAPTVTFNPANGATGVAISSNITITFNEAVRNIDNTELTDSNIDSLITLKLTNSSGNNINFDATINSNKTVITINPTSNLPNSQAVYVAIGATVEDSAGNSITAADATFTTTGDTTAPTLSQVTAVSTNNDTTPSYTFSSNEAGTISYGGSCSSSTTSATTDNNTITFNTLSAGTYSNCTINVTDAVGNISDTLTINSFSVGAIILFNQTANYHINGTTPTKTKGNEVASQNTCSSSATSLGITNSTVGVFATVSSDIKLFVTGGATSRQVVSINNSLISDSWDDLWDGAIDMSLNSAGVVSSSLWWSGSKGDGTKVTAINNNSAGNCYGSSGGAAGMSTATSEISTASGWGYTGNNSRLAEPLRPSWIGKYPDLGCGDELEIVCVAKPNF
jgi:hypothetical protein